ncbi:MAG: hypothetical protein WBK71_08665, partial [Acetomicrobium sp.]
MQARSQSLGNKYLLVAPLFGNGIKAPGSVLGVIVELQRVVTHKRLAGAEKPFKKRYVATKHPIVAHL